MPEDKPDETADAAGRPGAGGGPQKSAGDRASGAGEAGEPGNMARTGRGRDGAPRGDKAQRRTRWAGRWGRYGKARPGGLLRRLDRAAAGGRAVDGGSKVGTFMEFSSVEGK